MGEPPGQEGYCWAKARARTARKTTGCMLGYKGRDFIIFRCIMPHSDYKIKRPDLQIIHHPCFVRFAGCPSSTGSKSLLALYIQIINTAMQQKPTQAELRSRLHSERINATTLYYSLVKKEAKTFSILSNERLLIYDNTRRILFYNNDFKKLPFSNSIPQPKNDVSTPIQTSTFKNPNSSNDIQVRYTGKNPKGEMETVEWNFTCETQQLAKEWMTLFEEEKNRIMNEATGQKGGGFIHDTLLEAVQRESPPKQTILKPEEQKIRLSPEKEEPMRTSFKEQPSKIYKGEPSKLSYADPQANSLQPYQNSRVSIKNLDSSQQREPELQESHLQLPMLASNSIIRKSTQNKREPQMEVSEVKRVETTSQIRQPSRIRSEVEERRSIKATFHDWNMKFLRNPHESTILQFQQAANLAFESVWSKDSPVKGGLREYDWEGLLVSMANLNSEEARRLKREFRNYHFIMESCKAKLVVGVPMACLLEWQGIVALVKAQLPRECPSVPLGKIISQVRQLQRYTRIGNAVLEAATLVDTTEAYGMNGDKRLIFLNDLVQYLPLHTDQELSKTSLRPDYLLDNVTQIVPGGELKPSHRPEWKTLTAICEGVTKCLHELALHLNGQESLWVDALELKDIFHSFGVNFKLMPRVYAQLTNKYVKRQLMSVMAAKVAKEMIGLAYIEAFEQGPSVNRTKMVEECVKNLVEGNTSSSSDSWKDLSVKFKKQYGIPLNNSEIIGGFFLNSLIKLLHLECDLSKLNKSKRLFKEEGIIQSGFVLSIQPKIKSYSRFTTQLMEKVRFACSQEKKDEQIYDEIVASLHLDTSPLPPEYNEGKARECILQYLSYYTPPKALDANARLRNIPIYASIFHEPPSAFSLKLTRIYLEWCVKKECAEEFKRGIENALKIADYWLQETHLYHVALYQLLSDFYTAAGNGEESVNFMKEALSRCIRVCGAQSKAAGNKYYELGEKELKAGRKREAMESFNKARQNMQANKNDTIKYPQLQLRLASLQLNNGNLQACIEGSLQAIRQLEEFDKQTGTAGTMTEGLKIKTFEVLSRAYEIGGRREELRDMANLCAKKFNRSKSQWAFEQMLRICLSAVIFRFPIDKCQRFAQFIHNIMQENKSTPQSAVQELMSLSQDMVVMERFMSRFDHIEKMLGEANSKRGYAQDTKDFIHICRMLACSVGEDFVEGLVHQKQFE